MTQVTVGPNLRLIDQRSRSLGTKMLIVFHAYLREKWIDLHKNQLQNVPRHCISSNTAHQRKCLILVIFVYLCVCHIYITGKSILLSNFEIKVTERQQCKTRFFVHTSNQNRSFSHTVHHIIE